MKNVKKFLVLTLAGVFCAGTVLSVNAAPFDASWYAAQNPDVVAVYGNSAEALKAHYDRHGRNEYRMSSENDVEAQLHRLFNVEEYKTLYPDVAKVFGNNTDAIFQHYLSYGLLEGRRPSEQVSQEAALELRKVVMQALSDSGLNANPGSADLVKVLKGNITAKSSTLQAAMTQVQAVVKEAVNATIVADAARPDTSDDSDSSSSGSQGASSVDQNPTGGDQNPAGGDQEPSGGDQEPSGGDQEPSGSDQSPSDQEPSGSDQSPSDQEPSGGDQSPSDQSPSDQD